MAERWDIGTTLSSYVLAHELEMSRTPVIEALRRLEHDGLVEIVPQVGCRVVAHRARSLEELLTLRAALEGLAAAAAAPRLTAPALDELGTLAAELAAAGHRHDRATFIALDEALHLAVAEASGMPRLAASVRGLWTTLRVALEGTALPDGLLAAAGDDHAELVRALASGSGRRARRAMERHVWRGTLGLLDGRPWTDGGEGFEHRAVVSRSTTDLVTSVMPFVLAGLDRREPVLAVVCPETRRQLERLLGRRADRIELHDAAEWYAAPASTLEQFERYADMPREGRARIVATLAPGPASTVPAAEWTRLEAQLDAGLADRALSMLCVYDAATLPGELLRDAHRTHPVVRDGRRPADAPAYLTGPELLRELDAIGLPEPPVPAEHRPLDADLRDLRTHVLARARTAGLGVRRRQQLLLAVQEAARVVLDGGPAHSRLRSWIHEDTLVFELRGDDRRAVDAPSRPIEVETRTTDPPATLTAAQLICDLVQVRSDDRGLVLRLHVAL